MKRLFYILVIAITMVSCNDVGDYQYIITMKDGSKVKAWSVRQDGGGLTVGAPWEKHTFQQYYLSSDTYVRADYVGTKNINTD